MYTRAFKGFDGNEMQGPKPQVQGLVSTYGQAVVGPYCLL